MGQWRAMRVAVFNHKGGVGKSTLTAMLARELARVYHVAVLDCDGQFASSGRSLGLSNETLEYSVADFILDGRTPVKALVPQHVGLRQLQVVPNNRQIAFELQLSLTRLLFEAQAQGAEAAFHSILDTRLRELMDGRFHVILMDCPPAASQLVTKLAIAAADLVLVPVELDLNGLGAIVETRGVLAELPRVGRRVRFLANKVKLDGPDQRTAFDELKEIGGADLYSMPVPFSKAFGKAAAEALPIHRFSSHSRAAVDAIQNLGHMLSRMLGEHYGTVGCDPAAVDSELNALRAQEVE